MTKLVLTYLTFPVVFGGAIAAGVLALEHGTSRMIAVPVIVAVAALVIIGLERVHPYVESWNRPAGDVGTDTKHLIVSLVVVPELYRALAFGALYAAGAWLTTQVGFDLWPASWPILAQLAVAMVVAEFSAYWAHRWMHEHELLWRLHATHHAAERLYWLNSVRFHPLDTLMTYALQTVPLVLLGCPEPIWALFTIFTGVHGLFQHANLDIRLGPLNWVFSMAELHRWHHSKLVEEGNTNYGTNLILWDVAFGTRFLPDDRRPPEEIGVADLPRFPRDYLSQITSPFRWAETLERSRGAPNPAVGPAATIAAESAAPRPL